MFNNTLGENRELLEETMRYLYIKDPVLGCRLLMKVEFTEFGKFLLRMAFKFGIKEGEQNGNN